MLRLNGLCIAIAQALGYSGTVPSFYLNLSNATNATISDGTGTATVTGGGGGGVITPATLSVGAGTVSRISGVAPLAVHFTSEGTTSALTTKPFHEIEYRWDFGDVTAGNWDKGIRSGLSKNTHYGPNACHVFETPGTYTVDMLAADGTNTALSQVVITVDDPDTVFASDTICFSTDGDFTGAPAGAATFTTSNHATAINTYKSTKKRLLFKRGQTFTSTTVPIIDVQGPGIIGAFGTGAKPIWRRGGTSYTNFQIGTNQGAGGAVINDWRIVDIYIDGQLATDGNNIGAKATQSVTQILYLRTDVAGMYRGFDFSMSYISGASKVVHDRIAIHDCISTAIPGSFAGSGTDWRVYFGGSRLSVQGMEADNYNDGGSHVIRCEMLQNSVIANNTLSRAGPTNHIFKIHAPQWSGAAYSWLTNVYSEKNQVADNNLVGGSGGPWTVAFGPQDDAKDERIRDILFERNMITFGSNTQTGVSCWASRSTIRNNVFNINTTGVYPVGVMVTTRGIEPTPDDVCVLNNTMAGSSGGNTLTALQVGTATNTKVKNNLLYMTGTFTGGGKTAFTDGGTGTVASNNSSTAQLGSTNPLFATWPPVTFADHKVTTGSYAINGGTPVPVVTDAALVPLSLTTPDMGALSH